jgi:glutamyl-tRNA synthetase
LHIGGARTAIFNWLAAKSLNGKFLLRIEDTDKARSTEEYKESILNSLKWLGLYWDEEIFLQSENQGNQIDAVEKMIKNGSAYRCFCSQDLLDEKRKEAERNKRPYWYDGTCRELSTEVSISLEQEGNPFIVRVKVPEGKTEFVDLVHGYTLFNNDGIDDFVIMRRDKSPTYMLAVVVDDHLMNITHVIRGDDHLSNTPKQIMLYNALDWKVPEFAHMPMILGPDKARLSKRHGAVSVENYRKAGYLHEALNNFLILLGWSPGDDLEIISIDEVVKKFKIENSAKKSAVFDEQKLIWMNGKYISEMDSGVFADKLTPFLEEDDQLSGLIQDKGNEYLMEVIELSKNRLKLIPDFLKYCSYFYRDPDYYDPAAVKKHWHDENVIDRLSLTRDLISDCTDYTVEGIEKDMRSIAEESGISAAKLIHPARLALTGFAVSPGIFELMFILGRDTVIRRLNQAIFHLKKIERDT